MPTPLEEMVAIVRKDLHDEVSANYRWQKATLERHIQHAVEELSEAVPLEQTATIATTNGSREIDISSLTDLVIVKAVEFPLDCWPPSYQRFSHWKDTITLLGDVVPDGSNCHVLYGKLHTLDDTTSTIPSKFERLIAMAAGGFALVEWAAFAIDKVSVGGTAVPREFRQEGERRLQFFRKELKRLGRYGKLRISRLYRPTSPPPDFTTDYGP